MVGDRLSVREVGLPLSWRPSFGALHQNHLWVAEATQGGHAATCYDGSHIQKRRPLLVQSPVGEQRSCIGEVAKVNTPMPHHGSGRGSGILRPRIYARMRSLNVEDDRLGARFKSSTVSKQMLTSMSSMTR
jgi:hypothetical protein